MPDVLVCGPYPAPVGGISIHVERLCALLAKNGCSVAICDESAIRKAAVFNLRSFSLPHYVRLVLGSDVVHIHSSVSLFRFVHIFFALLFRKRIVVTIHSWRLGKVSSLIWGALLNSVATKVVLVNGDLVKKLPIVESKRALAPAFLPPRSVVSDIPAEILDFMGRSRANGQKVLVSNAFRVETYNGEDLYGIDLCIDMFDYEDLKRKVALVFVISDPEHSRHKIIDYRKLVKTRGLEPNFYIHCGAIDYCSLLKKTDISIRATNTDGDAISVRESIYLGVPCIASDCVDRPKEAVLFESRSAISLAEKVSENIESRRDQPRIDGKEYFEFYETLYGGD